jgi:hypothetical protein
MLKNIKNYLYDVNFKDLLKSNAYTRRLKTMNAKPSLLQQYTSHFASMLQMKLLQNKTSETAPTESFLTKLAQSLITQEWNLFDQAISTRGGLIEPGTKFNEAIVTNSH